MTRNTKPKLIDPSKHKWRLKFIGGSQSDNWNNILINQAINSLWTKHSDKDALDQQKAATLVALIEIAPKNVIEGMIAAQLIAAHNGAMECYQRAMLGEQTLEGHRENLTQANKLSRTCTELLDALNRHRGMGQQKVTVEHVHVHAGGQAVVGMVNTPGGGDQSKSKEQPHALAHTPGATMPCPNTQREFMHVASDGERPVPDARRGLTRRTEGE